MKRWMGLDLGTSAVKCLVTDARGAVLCLERASYAPPHTEGSRMEQRPMEWWDAASTVIRRCMAQLDGDVDAVSFSGQMSAFVLLNARGEPLRRAMLIADARAKAQSARLEQAFGSRFRAQTGNRPIEAFSVAKLVWLRENEPEMLQNAAHLLFVKDYIRYLLCGGIATDRTDAGNSLLLNLSAEQWDWELIEMLGLPSRLFPPILPSGAVCGAVTERAAAQTGLRAGTPVVTGAADMACSQLGTGALDPCCIAVTLSTSAQVVRATQSRPEAWLNKLTFHPSVQSGKFYAMASVFSGGLAFDWVRRLLSGGADTDFDALNSALQAYHAQRGASPVLFLPFLTGSGSPVFDSLDRATFWGLSPDTDNIQLTASVLEGVGYCIRENIELLDPEGRTSIRLAGGGSRLPIWGQLLCEILDRPVSLLTLRDTSVWGAALLAAGDGHCASDLAKTERTLLPNAKCVAAYQTGFEAYQTLQAALHRAVHQITEKRE